MRPIFCVISLGRAKGKTALLEWLTEKLTNSGIKIATIKHSTKRFDTEEKDTWRYLESRAAEVVYVSPWELITLRRTTASLADAIEALHIDPDLILVEGFKDAPYPKILCVGDPRELMEAVESIQNIVAVTGELDLDGVSNLAIRFMNKEEVYELLKQAVVDYWLKLIPNFDCGKCSYKSCKELSRAIRGGKATIRECSMRSTSLSRVVVDGFEVPLGTWPQKLLRELLVAFVKSLRLNGVNLDDAEKMSVEINLRTMKEWGMARG
ncbi:MAG: molybdopterin-guanine dinucleotide biosynthesis protein B [Nitrososphaeria archaeon]|nr:molybdopterin-guanine dinucleotide biosynthesis protein B [Nitrososphaeria archaeon]